MDILSDPLTLLPLIAALVAAGTAIGFLAGLFGVGGGAISVPVFFEILALLDIRPMLPCRFQLGRLSPSSFQHL